MITREQYQLMSCYEKALIMPRRIDQLLWLESINNISDQAAGELSAWRLATATAVL